MMVHTLDRNAGHLGAVGLYIGNVNVERYFPRDFGHIELELDHLRIVCPLEPDFWEECPEIHDLRLSSWLESKRNSGKLATQPAPVAMIPCGDKTFRLEIVVNHEALADKSPVETAVVAEGMDGTEVGQADSSTVGVIHAAKEPVESVAYASQIASPLALLDRRKQDLGRLPDRRKR